MTPNDKKLLDLLAARPDGARVRDLFEHFRSNECAANAAHRLWELGLVERTKDGVYTLTDEGRRALAEGIVVQVKISKESRNRWDAVARIARSAGGGDVMNRKGTR